MYSYIHRLALSSKAISCSIHTSQYNQLQAYALVITIADLFSSLHHIYTFKNPDPVLTYN